MSKRLLPILIALCIAAPCSGQDFVYFKKKQAAAGGTCADPTTTYVLWENFSGANADNNSYSGYNQTGWTATGTYSINATPVLDSGSNCQNSLTIDESAASQAVNTFTANDNGVVYFLFRKSANPAAANDVMTIRGSSATVGKMRMATNGTVSCSNGTTAATYTVTAMNNDTVYHVWLHGRKGSGADGYCSVGFSTDGTEPTSGNTYTETNGNGIQQAQTLWVGNTIGTANATWYYDKIRLQTGTDTIGSNPD